MGRSAPKIVEMVHGQGQVLLGQRLIAVVRYSVTVYQHYDVSDPISGPKIRTPVVQNTVLDMSERVPGSFDEVFTLHMADGRKLDFYAIGDNVKARGGMYRDD